jgi:adenine-specific DNA-methyltransferase
VRAQTNMRPSEALRDVEKLAQPFHDQLLAHADRQTCRQLLGIPETFNYLLGLHVQRRRVYDDDGRRYVRCRGQVDHCSIAVV